MENSHEVNSTISFFLQLAVDCSRTHGFNFGGIVREAFETLGVGQGEDDDDDEDDEYMMTRSLGTLRAPTSSWRPSFRPCDTRVSDWIALLAFG